MKKFILKTLTLLIPILVFITCFEVYLRNSNLPNIYSFKNELLNQKHEALVLGNSHALRGILAENLNYNAISLANVSQSINIDYKWLKKSLKNNKLKFIILNFSIPTLTGNLFESKEKWRIKNYNIYTDLRLSFKPSNNFESLSGEQIDNFSKLFENHKDYLEPEILNKGSFPIDTVLHFEAIKKHAVKTSRRHTEKTNNIKENISLLNQIISLSINNKFDVIIVTPPTTKLYQDLVPKKIERMFYSELSSVKSENSNVYWLNFYKDTSYKYGFFKDSDHLNLKGAIKLTEEINIFLNKIYLN